MASKRHEESTAWSKGKTARASSIHPLKNHCKGQHQAPAMEMGRRGAGVSVDVHGAGPGGSRAGGGGTQVSVERKVGHDTQVLI